MIFTARFGALAARPVFPNSTVPEHEDVIELQTHDVEYQRQSEKSAA